MKFFGFVLFMAFANSALAAVLTQTPNKNGGVESRLYSFDPELHIQKSHGRAPKGSYEESLPEGQTLTIYEYVPKYGPNQVIRYLIKTGHSIPLGKTAAELRDFVRQNSPSSMPDSVARKALGNAQVDSEDAHDGVTAFATGIPVAGALANPLPLLGFWIYALGKSLAAGHAEDMVLDFAHPFTVLMASQGVRLLRPDQDSLFLDFMGKEIRAVKFGAPSQFEAYVVVALEKYKQRTDRTKNYAHPEAP